MTESSTAHEFIILGSGTSHGVPMIGCHCPVCTSDNPRNNRTRTGAVIQAPLGNLLIDTPPELRIQLLREKVDLIHGALYTHSHADHLFGLDDLRLFGHYLDGPVTLYCEEGVERHIRATYSYAFTVPYPNDHPGAIPNLVFERLSLEPVEILGINIQPIRLMHGKLPVLGFRFNDIAFCTDVSHIPEESLALLQGLDVLILDALREKPHPTHFSVGQAVEIIEQLKPKRAYLTHISHYLEHEATNAHLPKGVELAFDGLRIPL